MCGCLACAAEDLGRAMRQIVNINAKWVYEVPATLPLDWNFVKSPQCRNTIDGQDGGNGC